MKKLSAKGKSYDLPIYLPDATKAVTKSVDSVDLQMAQVKGVVVNTYHLQTYPGNAVLTKFGGIKNFMNYNGLVVSDSGGWQVFSLIKRNGHPGKITSEGVEFTIGNSDKSLFTPEISIETQFNIGSDILICLDDFVKPKSSKSEIERVVENTVNWAKRSKDTYNRILDKLDLNNDSRPLLFSVIQGGFDKGLRKQCAEELIQTGFDGYGFGGYVVNELTGKLDLEISAYIANLIPDDKYKFALGVGKPDDIAACKKMGWEIFDCTLPTRDARHKRLYISKGATDYDYLYINKKLYQSDERSIDHRCDCHTCKNYSRAYLHHLFNIEDTLSYRLATIHNMRFYTRLIESLM